MEEALFLTRFATKVTVIHRRDSSAPRRSCWNARSTTRKFNSCSIPWSKMSTTHNKQEVTGLKLRNVKTGEVCDFPTSALFLGIGHEPNAKLFAGQLDTGRRRVYQDAQLRVHYR